MTADQHHAFAAPQPARPGSPTADGRPFPLQPVTIRVPDGALDDLRARLSSSRLPGDEGNRDWRYGVSAEYLTELLGYWREQYDWRRAEELMNRYEHYFVSVDGVPIHFMRRSGLGRAPKPLLLMHGWPWTFWHFAKVIDSLADPAAYGGDPDEAFDVIVPSLPGFAFSSPIPEHPGMNFWSMAEIVHRLMTNVLGYETYAAAGCDVGALVAGQLGHRHSSHLYGIHIGSGQRLDLFTGDRAWDVTGGRPLPDDLPREVRVRQVQLEHRFAVHLAAHTLTPSTLAHGLSDSPAGLLAWLLERWAAWSQNGGDVETVFSKDDLLTHATLYWVTNSIGTSIRTYANNQRYPWTPAHDRWPVVEAPTGITFVGHENPPGVSTRERVAQFLASDRAAWYNHVNLTAHDHGGHFIPWENPRAWVTDLRRTFKLAGASREAPDSP